MFLLVGSLGITHPSTLLSRSLDEPTDLGVHQKGTIFNSKELKKAYNRVVKALVNLFVVVQQEMRYVEA